MFAQPSRPGTRELANLRQTFLGTAVRLATISKCAMSVSNHRLAEATKRALRWLTLPLAFSAMGHASQGPDTSTGAVVAAAAAYIADYQRHLTSILADEFYTQDVITQIPRDASMPRARHMTSEVFFMFAPGNQDWMAIRDVMAIDGGAVDDRPDVKEALRTLPTSDVAATFKAYNSRFNIGRTYRNFNEPTLSLLVFDTNHRDKFSFNRKRVQHAGDTVLVTLTFVEKESPTLIHDPRRGDVFSTGEVVVEAGTGRVRRAVLEATTNDVKLELTTTYSPDERLGMWVPTLFREQYEHGLSPNSTNPDSPSDYECIVCEARYRNYRRFETSVRIK